MTTPKQPEPATAAGRGLVWALKAQGLDASGILAIEDEAAAEARAEANELRRQRDGWELDALRTEAEAAQAAAGTLALREALGGLIKVARAASTTIWVGSSPTVDGGLLLAEIAKSRTVLADTAPAAAEIEARIELGDAWHAAEAALPQGWQLWGVKKRIGSGHGPDGACEAWAGVPNQPDSAKHAYAKTPAAALRKLAAALREQLATEEAGE